MFKKLKQVFREDSPYRLFLLTLLITGVGYGIYKGILDNYMAEVVHIEKMDRGVVEFFREIPGLLLIFITAALYTLSAERIYKIGAVIMLGGMVMISAVPATKALVTMAICLYSLGEHIQLGMKNTLSLEYAKAGQGGKALGHQNAMSNIGTVAGYGIVIAAFSLFSTEKPFRLFFSVGAVLIGIAMLLSFRIPGKSRQTGQKRFYFRKKFTKYYMLEVFYGARKQVFFTFGPYLLILHYGADAPVISLLFAISAVAAYFLAPLVGNIIDKVGYKAVENLYFSAVFNFRSQFAEGYKSQTDKTPISAFFAPAYATLGLGIDYTPSKNISVNFAPLTGKTVMVKIPELRSTYGNADDQFCRFELGAQLKMDGKIEVQNFKASTSVTLFSDYLNKPLNIKVNWDANVEAKISKYFSVTLRTNMIYDDNIKLTKVNDRTGETYQAAGVQFKELFSIGFTYTIGDKKK